MVVSSCQRCAEGAKHRGIVVFATRADGLWNVGLVTCLGVQECIVTEEVKRGVLLEYYQDPRGGCTLVEPVLAIPPEQENFEVYDGNVSMVPLFKYTVPPGIRNAARPNCAGAFSHKIFGKILLPDPHALAAYPEVHLAIAYFHNETAADCPFTAVGFRPPKGVVFDTFDFTALDDASKQMSKGIFDFFAASYCIVQRKANEARVAAQRRARYDDPDQPSTSAASAAAEAARFSGSSGWESSAFSISSSRSSTLSPEPRQLEVVAFDTREVPREVPREAPREARRQVVYHFEELNLGP